MVLMLSFPLCVQYNVFINNTESGGVKHRVCGVLNVGGVKHRVYGVLNMGGVKHRGVC